MCVSDSLTSLLPLCHKKLLKTLRWATLLYAHTVVYFDSIPLTRSAEHQMWIHPPLKIVPNKFTISSCLSNVWFKKKNQWAWSWEPQTESQKVLRDGKRCPWLFLTRRNSSLVSFISYESCADVTTILLCVIIVCVSACTYLWMLYRCSCRFAVCIQCLHTVSSDFIWIYELPNEGIYISCQRSHPHVNSDV